MKEFFTKLTSQSKTVNAATQKTDNIKKNVGETSIAVIRLEKKWLDEILRLEIATQRSTLLGNFTIAEEP